MHGHVTFMLFIVLFIVHNYICILYNVFHDYGINYFDVKTEYYRLEYFIYIK